MIDISHTSGSAAGSGSGVLAATDSAFGVAGVSSSKLNSLFDFGVPVAAGVAFGVPVATLPLAMLLGVGGTDDLAADRGVGGTEDLAADVAKKKRVSLFIQEKIIILLLDLAGDGGTSSAAGSGSGAASSSAGASSSLGVRGRLPSITR